MIFAAIQTRYGAFGLYVEKRQRVSPRTTSHAGNATSRTSGDLPEAEFQGPDRSKDCTTASAVSSKKACTASITFDPALINPASLRCWHRDREAHRTEGGRERGREENNYLDSSNSATRFQNTRQPGAGRFESSFAMLSSTPVGYRLFTQCLPPPYATQLRHYSTPRGSSCRGSRLSRPW